jgi:hypothetical protein
MLGRGQIDSQSWVPEQHIVITGGLPELPGTNVIMPRGIEGQGTELQNGHTIDLEKNSELPAPNPQAPDTSQ